MTLPYGGGWLDRANDRRTDPGWVADVLRRPASRVLPLWRDACLVAGPRSDPVAAPVGEAAGLLAAGEPVLLGLDGRLDGGGAFAVDLSALDEGAALALAGADRALDVRALVGALDAREAAVIGHARGVLHWHRHHRYCGACGSATRSRDGGSARECLGAGCGRLHFPRIEPAVIALVEAPGLPARCLLARHRGAAPDGLAALAGFLEVGESLEDAVRRELAEEVGVEVASLAYQASQAWPFPAGLMVGFRAVAASEAVRVDHAEIEEARWCSRPEVADRVRRGLLRRDSIEAHLIEAWLREGG